MDRLPQPSSSYYSSEMAYTGWWANASEKGQGIATVEKYYSIEGEWGLTAGFPNDGEDFVDPNIWRFDEYTVQSLYSREKPSDQNDTIAETTYNSDTYFYESDQSDEDFYYSITINFS